MNQDERRGYQRGYNNAHRWPKHRPPYPPIESVREVMAAAHAVRDQLDNYLAQVDDEHEEQTWGPHIDRIDRAFEAIAEWLLEPTP